MGLKGFISKNILNRSNSLKYYKNQFEILNKRVDKLEKDSKKIKTLEKRVNKLSNRSKKYDQINETNRRLFNTLYLDHELQPGLLLEKFQEFCLELIKFIDNVCKKHDIDWMIEGGTFLGAIRHGGFIPWDDDMDCGMMRSDYLKFIEVLPGEIEKYGLKDDLLITFKPRDDIIEGATSFLQLHYNNSFENRFNLMAIDFFPYDFLKEYNGEDITEKYEEVQLEYYKDIVESGDYGGVLERYYDRFNLTFEKTPYFIQGVEGTSGINEILSPKVFETDKMLPFKKVQFENLELTGPKDYDYYLTLIYKSYWAMPKILNFHNRMKRLRQRENITDIIDKHIVRMKKINEEFEF